MEIQGPFGRMTIRGIFPAPRPIRRISYEERLSSYATAAMNHYNSMHHYQYDLLKPLYMQSLYFSGGPGGHYHLTFIGRRKDSSSLKLKLFFAELANPDDVKYCGVAEPGNPFFKLGCGQCHPDGVIYHPIGKYEQGGYRHYKSPPPKMLTPREESAKTLLRELYTFECNIHELDFEEDKELRNLMNLYGLAAVEWYNDVHKVAYEFLELVVAVRFGASVPRYMMGANLWVHFIFKARNKDPKCADASPAFFFSELNLNMGGVVICAPVPPADYGCGTGIVKGTGTVIGNVNGTEAESGCIVCRHYCNMFHPQGPGNYYCAGRKGGTFGDALVKDRSWRAKVELLPKVDASASSTTS